MGINIQNQHSLLECQYGGDSWIAPERIGLLCFSDGPHSSDRKNPVAARLRSRTYPIPGRFVEYCRNGCRPAVAA